MKTYKGLIKSLDENQIIVFGSNPEGIHGGGVARIAYENYGAEYGNGRGLQGKSYALVTKNLTPYYREKSTGIVYEKAGFRSVTSEQIIENIKELYDFANKNPELEFLVAYTDSDNNLNGYLAKEMADMFSAHPIPDNIVFNEDFAKLL